MKLFGREPSLWISAVGSGLSLIAGFGVGWLTPAEAALVIVLLNAILGVINALLALILRGTVTPAVALK